MPYREWQERINFQSQKLVSVTILRKNQIDYKVWDVKDICIFLRQQELLEIKNYEFI